MERTQARPLHLVENAVTEALERPLPSYAELVAEAEQNAGLSVPDFKQPRWWHWKRNFLFSCHDAGASDCKDAFFNSADRRDKNHPSSLNLKSVGRLDTSRILD